MVTVEKADDGGDGLFRAVTDVGWVSGPGETAFVRDPRIDTGNATQMARAAAASGLAARVYVVEGRSQHINLIVEPAPVRVRVVEVVPPEPPKLLDMARRVLDYDEDLDPVELELVAIDLNEVGGGRDGRALAAAVPLRRAGPVGAGRASWTPARRSPRTGRCWAASARARSTPSCTAASRRRAWRCARGCEPARASAPTLLKCCLRERGIESDGATRRRALGRDARGGPRGAAPPRARRWRRCRHDRRAHHRLRRLRAPVEHAGHARALRRARAPAGLAGHHRRARARAGRPRPDPGGGGQRDRGHRPRRRLRPPGDRRRHARERPLDARESSGPGARCCRRGARVAVLGRDRPGRDRHVDGARHARRARRDRARPAAARAGARPRWRASERETVVLGRTHGQPGLPITFGFKAAVWTGRGPPPPRARSRRRGRAWPSASSPGRSARARSGARRGSSCRPACARGWRSTPPDITWLTARDRVAELLTLLAMVTGTLAKIGREVYELQRPEIGELAEATHAGLVGSITMPHKRNPELSEHLGTLGRLVRGAAGLALEGLVHEHERDGAAWKAEWAYLPEACLMTRRRACASASRSSRAWRSIASGWRPTSPRSAATCSPSRSCARSPIGWASTARTRSSTRRRCAGRAEGRTLREALGADPAVTAELARRGARRPARPGHRGPPGDRARRSRAGGRGRGDAWARRRGGGPGDAGGRGRGGRPVRRRGP